MFKVYFSCIFQLFLLKLYYGKAIYICLDVIVVSCIYYHDWNLSLSLSLFLSSNINFKSKADETTNVAGLKKKKNLRVPYHCYAATLTKQNTFLNLFLNCF